MSWCNASYNGRGREYNGLFRSVFHTVYPVNDNVKTLAIGQGNLTAETSALTKSKTKSKRVIANENGSAHSSGTKSGEGGKKRKIVETNLTGGNCGLKKEKEKKEKSCAAKKLKSEEATSIFEEVFETSDGE